MRLLIRRLGSNLFGTADSIGTSAGTADAGKMAHLDANGKLDGSVTGVWRNAGAPVDGTTFANKIAKGETLIDTTNGVAYLNTGTKASPVFKTVTHA